MSAVVLDGAGRSPSDAPDASGTDDEIDVVVADEQDEVPIDVERWAALGRAALGEVGVRGPAELVVTFVASEAMAALNAEHMGGQGPTDVLSFPIDGETVLAGPRVDATPGVPLLLGDIVICPAVAAANAPEHAGSLDDEIALLVVHGLLHLLGMDHAEDAERDLMQARERELLAAHHGPLARDPWSS